MLSVPLKAAQWAACIVCFQLRELTNCNTPMNRAMSAWDTFQNTALYLRSAERQFAQDKLAEVLELLRRDSVSLLYVDGFEKQSFFTVRYPQTSLARRALKIRGCRTVRERHWDEYDDYTEIEQKPEVDNGMLFSILSSWLALEIIDLSGTKQCFSDSVLHAIGAHSKQLTEIHIPETNFSEEAMIAVVQGCPLLEYFNFRGAGEGYNCLSDALLTVMSTRSKHMKKIDINSCQKFTDEGVIAVVQGCPLLMTINLSNTYKCFSDALLKAIGARSKKLKKILKKRAREKSQATGHSGHKQFFAICRNVAASHAEGHTY